MIFLHIDPTNKRNTKKFNKYLKEGRNVFVLFYLEGCGPCNATRPEWKKLENIFADNEHQNIVIADIDQSIMDELENVDVQPKGFPSMYHICKKKGICNDYEDEDLSKKDRTIDSFVEWIENHIKKSSRENLMRGGKWSLKYKRSINCRRPKGFSQRQHCKYGRKKIHTRKNKNKNKNKTKKRGM